jgi:CheY-like chemotaxis protein
MPEMDGMELGRGIRSIPKFKKLPLLMLSSLGIGTNPKNEKIIDIFLTKPVKQSNLFDAIMQCLGEKSVHEFTHSTVSKLDDTLAIRIPLKILIAEDNAINQKLALKIFEKMGYHADIAGNGLEVLKALELQKYDIIFMDVQMPDMDGLEATEQVIKKYGKKRPFIIAMTANAMQGDKERCLEAGMDDYISKPIRLEEITRVIKEWGGEIISHDMTEENNMPEMEIMDWTIVDSIRDLDDGDEAGTLLVELVSTFITESDENLENLKKLIGTKTYEEVIMLSHKMKGSSANLGAKGFSELCAEIEKKTKNNDMNGLLEILNDLQNSYEQTKNEFINYLSAIGREMEI